MMVDCAPVAPQALAVCGDGDVCQGIDETQKSKVWVHSLFSLGKDMVRPPGFEPGLRAWKARIITRLDYGRSRRKTIVSGYDLRVLIEWTKRNRLVEGFNPNGSKIELFGRNPSRRKTIVSGYDLSILLKWTNLDRLVMSEKAYYQRAHICVSRRRDKFANKWL